VKFITLPLACLLANLLIPAAQANDDSLNLIASCQELVDIYAKRDEQHLLAGVTTGLSEALRAGYCMGVVDEYRRQSTCATDDWFIQAQRIARTPIPFDIDVPFVVELLEKSCER